MWNQLRTKYQRFKHFLFETKKAFALRNPIQVVIISEGNGKATTIDPNKPIETLQILHATPDEQTRKIVPIGNSQGLTLNSGWLNLVGNQNRLQPRLVFCTDQRYRILIETPQDTAPQEKKP